MQGQSLNTTNDIQAPPDLLSISRSTRVEESQGHTLGPSRLGRQPRQVHDYVLSGNECAEDEKRLEWWRKPTCSGVSVCANKF